MKKNFARQQSGGYLVVRSWSLDQDSPPSTSVTFVFLPVMSDSPPRPRPDSAQRPTPLIEDPNLRGYFVDDEFTGEASISSAGMPPIEATSASSPSPPNSRRKQTSPHKVQVSPSEVITQRGSTPSAAPAASAASALRDAIETESDSEDVNLNENSNSSNSSPSKTPLKKKKAAHPSSKSESPKKSSSTKKSKSEREDNSKLLETPPTTPSHSKKRKTSASQPSTSGVSEVKVEKDQVENELEAMFAGMDEESKSPTKPSSSIPATPLSTPVCSVSIPKVEVSDLSPDLVALSKKRGRPSKEEAQKRLEAGILSKRQKVLLRKGESLENIFARFYSNTTGKKVSEEVQPPQLKKKKKKKKPTGPQASQENARKSNEALNGDSAFPGPYVRVVSGADGALKSSNVVNGPQIVPRNMSVVDEAAHRILVDALGRPSSTNDPSYDSKRPDETWLCVFCHKGSHACQMGDLFGPYFVSASSLPRDHFAVASIPQALSSLGAATPAASKFVVDAQLKKKKKRKSSGAGAGAPTAPQLPPPPQDKPVEVWFHEDCVCWMPDMRLLGSKLYGLEEAIAGASEALCDVCSKTGATAACVGGRRPACKQMAHYPCAAYAGWKIEADAFQAYCKKHSV